jgi:hypothetical protein
MKAFSKRYLRPLILLEGFRRGVATAIVLVFCLWGVQLTQADNRQFDVMDEGAHFSYAITLSHRDVPKWGSKYTQEMMRVQDCLGSKADPGKIDCSARQRDPRAFPPQGYNYEAQQPPLGYVPYALGARLFAKAAPGDYLNDVRNFGGTILILLAGLVLWFISRRLDLGFWSTLVLGTVVLLSPVTIHALTFVTNDGATLVGAMAFTLFLLGSFAWTRRRAIVVGVGIGLALGLVKASMLLLPLGSVAAVAGYATFRLIRRRSRLVQEVSKPEFLFAASSFVSAGLAAAVFNSFQTSRALVDPAIVLESIMGVLPKVTSVQTDTIYSSIANLMNEWLNPSNGLIPHPPFFAAANSVFLVLLGLSAWSLLANRPGWGPELVDPSRVLALNWIITIMAFGISWPVLLFFQGGFNFDAPTRYGLLVLPLAAALIASGLRSKVVRGQPTA